MELRWQTNFEASAMHAAWAVATNRSVIDKRLIDELAPAAADLSQTAQFNSVPSQMFWRQLIALSVDMPGNHELADRVLRRVVGGGVAPTAISRLASAIQACEVVVRQRFPRLMDEINLRIGPLQSAWEARGPGLMTMIRRMTEEDFLVESATVLPVQPVCGGDGMAHLSTNRIHLEAMLTDADPRLPETLRMAWLLGQLNLDLPKYTDAVHGHSKSEIAELALVPIVLAAASELQMASCDEASMTLAISMWMKLSAEQAASLSSPLSAWWETASTAAWPWSTSLTALAEMLKTAPDSEV